MKKTNVHNTHDQFVKKSLSALTALALCTAFALPTAASTEDFSAGSDQSYTAPARRVITDKDGTSYVFEDDFVYRISPDDDKTCAVVEYKGSDKFVNIPAEFDGRKVTVIDGWSRREADYSEWDEKHPLGVTMGAFANNKDIEAVIIPDSVTDIEAEAFYGCKSLKSVKFGKGLKTIGGSAFYNCVQLSSVQLPDSVSKIDSCALGFMTADDGQFDILQPGFSITARGGSAAESYAKNAGIKFNSIHESIAKATVSGIKTKAYTGKAITQKITVKLGDKVLKNGTDYTVTYSNNKKIGKAKLTITGKGGYCGSITKEFTINPAKQEIQKLSSRSKGLFIDWRQKDSATGYEVQYSTSSKFDKSSKLVIKNKKTDKATISKLSANKKYYVRTRSYTIVGDKKYYGEWSNVKSAVTKK